MSKYLTNAAIEQFAAEVHRAYAASGSMLDSYCRQRLGVVGNKCKFPKFDKGMASKRSAPSVDVTPMNVSNDSVELTLENWEASDYTDLFDQAEVNWSERQELAVVIADAMRRRKDQMIIDALYQGGTFASGNTILTSVGGAVSNLNTSKIRALKAVMDKKNIPAQGRQLLVHANNLSALLGEDKITSSDYATVKALVQGEIDTWMGFKFLMLGDRDEGGIPTESALRICMAWHKNAIGYGEGIAETPVTVDWIPTKKSWLSSASLKANAKVIDTIGVFEIQCTDANTYNQAS